MSKPFTPRGFNDLVLDHLGNAPRTALWAKPGMGKSVMTLTHLDYLHNVWGESRPTLVLAPLRVAQSTWSTEVAKWDHLSGLDVVNVVGSGSERKAALKKQAQVYVTNYENLVWLTEHFRKEKRAWPFATVVADEATKLKGFRLKQGGVRAQALGKVAHKYADRWINLTGTPSPNGLQDLWGQTWFLDAGERLGRTYTAFQERWFRPLNTGDFVKWVPTGFAQQEIQERVADLCLALDPKDWFDLTAPVVTVVEVDLPASARMRYRELEKEFFTMVEAKEIEAFNAAAKSSKLLQLASGAMYLDPKRYGPGEWVECHTEKLDALAELAEDTGDDTLLVSYYFKSDLARLQRTFPEGIDLALPEGLARAKRGEGKLWFAQPASVSEGIDGLQEHCHTVVFFSQDWNLGHHDQLIERVGPMRQLQSGKNKVVFLYYLVAKKTIDELVVQRREGKASSQELLLSYTKHLA